MQDGRAHQPRGKVYFIGVGPGDPELLTVKGKRILEEADLIIFTGSLINRELFRETKPGAEILNSAGMHLEEILEAMIQSAREGKVVARVHDGDPSLFNALREQILPLKAAGVEYEIVPGVSSVFAAAATLKAELTIPDLSQTVILTRMEGRTPVPEKEKLRLLASHEATLVLFLSAGLIEKVVEELRGGYPEETPVAVVYKASLPEEKVVRGTLADIAEKAREKGIDMHALILVGKVFDPDLWREGLRFRSRLYDKDFSHSFRKAIGTRR